MTKERLAPLARLAYFILIIAIQAVIVLGDTSVPSSRNSSVSLSRLCLTNPNEAPLRLSFIHVFKTGGSSLRNVMRQYAQECTYSLGIFVKCSPFTTQDTKIKLPEKIPCTLKERIDANMYHSKKPDRDAKFRDLKNMNIVAGHFNFGLQKTYAAITDAKSLISFTWVRDPLSMLVSSSTFLIQKQRNTVELDEITDKMIVKVRNVDRLYSNKGFYSQYVTYYVDSTRVKLKDVDPKDIINQVWTNLETMSMIGVIENHDTSMKMLHALLDPDNTLGDEFWKRAVNTERNRSELKDSNGNAVNRTSIFYHLKQKTNMLETVMTELYYEYQIYHKAIELHTAICVRLKQTHPSIMEGAVCEVRRGEIEDILRDHFDRHVQRNAMQIVEMNETAPSEGIESNQHLRRRDVNLESNVDNTETLQLQNKSNKRKRNKQFKNSNVKKSIEAANEASKSTDGKFLME